jgi:hypothetical protein
MRQVRQSPTVAPVRRSQTRHKVLMSLMVFMSVVLWLTEDKIATAASGDRTMIRQRVVKSLGYFCVNARNRSRNAFRRINPSASA